MPILLSSLYTLRLLDAKSVYGYSVPVCVHDAENTTVVSTLSDDSSSRQSMENRSSGGSIWKQTNCVSTEYITLQFID